MVDLQVLVELSVGILELLLIAGNLLILGRVEGIELFSELVFHVSESSL